MKFQKDDWHCHPKSNINKNDLCVLTVEGPRVSPLIWQSALNAVEDGAGGHSNTSDSKTRCFWYRKLRFYRRTAFWSLWASVPQWARGNYYTERHISLPESIFHKVSDLELRTFSPNGLRCSYGIHFFFSFLFFLLFCKCWHRILLLWLRLGLNLV